MYDFAYLPLLELTWDLFARGGGGGSGGGGGGGGGLAGLMLIGFIPAYFVCNWAFRKISANAGLYLGSLAGLIVTVGVAWVFREKSLDAFLLFLLVGSGAVIGVYSGLHNVINRALHKIKHTKPLLLKAAKADPAWHEPAIREHFEQVFQQFQRDWSHGDIDSIRSYSSQPFARHMALLLLALADLHRYNVVGNPRIERADVMEITDHVDNDHDKLTMYVHAQADDGLFRKEDDSMVYMDTSAFHEFWHFDRRGDTWILEGIDQATEDPTQLQAGLKDYAQRNDMFYKPDMGWLLIPERGRLFSKAAFKKSDINNHVIGEWNGLRVQLYTYVQQLSRDRADNYLIGQLTVPKTYGGILVEYMGSDQYWIPDPLNLRMAFVPKGYQKVTMEWPDFYKRWRVSATDMDKVTSFELLNPAFMAWLYDTKLPISIEVVDNIIYFYTLVNPSQDDYGEMLTVLQKAHKELRR